MTNEIIAEKIMELKAPDGKFYSTPDYLNDWNAARLVIEKMRWEGYRPVMTLYSDGWYVEFIDTDGSRHKGEEYKADQFQSLSIAICTAALKAIERK